MAKSKSRLEDRGGIYNKILGDPTNWGSEDEKKKSSMTLSFKKIGIPSTMNG